VFERFTERARHVVVLAQDEARLLKHGYIGTEHILLGLIGEEEGLAARALESLDITVERVRAAVVRTVGTGEEAVSGQIPFTPRAKKVLELALREALSLSHNYIGTEHILLGLVRENEGVAARILLDFDADADTVRNLVLRMVGGTGSASSVVVGSTASARTDPPRQLIDGSWLGGLAPVLAPLGPEIRRALKRAPDTGDLLLALASAPDTRVADALRSLGVDLDALAAAVEQIRAQAEPSQDDLARELDHVRRSKERAAEEQAYEAAAQLRDEERRLAQALADAAISAEGIERIWARLGLSGPRERPEEEDEQSSG
jgi:ATP-dependent Clp protease ATP-binding subunit ClpA